MYLRRAYGLSRSVARLVLSSLAVLLVNQVLNLATPSLQGRILDAVVASEAEVFRHFLLVYLVVNLAKGLCGAVQSVLVNVLPSPAAHTVLTVWKAGF